MNIIPILPDPDSSRIDRLLAKYYYKTGPIRPVVYHEEQLWYIKEVDPYNVAFTWDPERTEKAPPLKVNRVIPTVHRYGAPSLFKPSIAEVFCQMGHDLTGIVAFRTEGSDFPTSQWSRLEHWLMQEGYHLAQTTLYEAQGVLTHEPYSGIRG